LLAQQLQQFFNHYHQAFKAQNIVDVLSCYHFPCTLVTPDRLVLLNNRQAAEVEFNEIFLGINRLGIQSFKALEASYDVINTDDDNTILMVNIHWQFFNKEKDILADFAALYHIIKHQQQLNIFQVISHENEQVIDLPFSLTLLETIK
jgi:predicted transcriptional regulator